MTCDLVVDHVPYACQRITNEGIPVRIIRSIVTLAVAAVAVLVLTGAPAQAGSALTCPASRVCLFEHANFDGAFIAYTAEAVGSCWNLPASWNDRATSLVNRLSRPVRFYLDANCVDSAWYLGANSSQSNLGGTGVNDEITSYKYL